jgi:CPA1 family monovalent cation:H+ antiporter
MYPATYLPRWLSPALARRDPAPPWQWPFALAFTGVRGIVSLAAALALPLTTSDGAPFPNRELILVLAFVVVLVTLVGQGLTLPWVVRALGLANAGQIEQAARRTEEFEARKQAIEAAGRRLDALAKDADVPEDVIARLRAHHGQRFAQNRIRSEAKAAPFASAAEAPPWKAPQATFDDRRRDDGEEQRRRIAKGDELELLLLGAERDLINEKYRQGSLKAETRRRLERELDLREAQLASVRNEDYWE